METWKTIDIKVSVIMPIRNTVSYIRECMESLINQTLKEIEILCIDAESTDGTREILQEYADKDNRVHIYEDKKGSTGYANNYGMQKAKGEYMAIVEPDDFVALDMYEKLYEAAKENNADVVRADYKIFFGNGESREYFEKAVACIGDYGRLLDATAEQRLFKNDMSTWAGIYRLGFLRENHICHNETPGAAYQDNGFWFLVMAHAKRLYYLSVSGYRYRMDNPGSSVHNRRKVFAICDEYEFIAEYMQQEEIYEKFEDIYLWAKFIRYLSSYYRLDDALKREFAERFALEMKGHYGNSELMQEEVEKEKAGSTGQRIGQFSNGQIRLLHELLEGGQIFHEHIMEEKAQFHRLIESDKVLVQYGCGSDGFRLMNYMRETGCLNRVECLCDGNPKLWGSEIFGKRVCSLDEVKKRYPEAEYLVTSINCEDEIRRFLIDQGIKNRNIHVACFC